MKILKAILLIFIISLTVNNINAQIQSNPQHAPDPEINCGLIMSVEQITDSAEQACFEVTLFDEVSSGPILFIEAEGNPIQVSTELSFTATVCTGRHGRPKQFLIECGTKDDSGDIICKDSCTVGILP